MIRLSRETLEILADHGEYNAFCALYWNGEGGCERGEIWTYAPTRAKRTAEQWARFECAAATWFQMTSPKTPVR